MRTIRLLPSVVAAVGLSCTGLVTDVENARRDAGDAGDAGVTSDAGASRDAGPVSSDPWLPGPGRITNVNQNSALDVDIHHGEAHPGLWYNGFYGGNGFADMTSAWNGAVWCPGASTDGVLAFFGGGHGANIGNYSYFFDVTTRRWAQVGADRNLPETDAWLGAGGSPDLRDPDWLDYDFNGSRIIVLAHQYAMVAHLMPDEGGASPRGSLLVPNAEQDQSAGHASKWGGWAFDLSTGTMSRTHRDTPRQGIGSGSLIAVKDTVHRKLWYFEQGRQTAYYEDLSEPVPRALHEYVVTTEPGAPNDGYMVVYDVTWLFVPEANAALAFLGGDSEGSAMGVVMIDFSTGFPVMAAVAIPSLPAGDAGMRHGGHNVGAAWDSKRHRAVLYEGLGDQVTTVLTPSSTDFRTATWRWSRESYQGRAPANAQGEVGVASSLEGAWGRFRYVPTLDVFLWTDGPSTQDACEDGVTRNGIVQFWNPVGAPL